MTERTITLDEEAYDRLLDCKREGESVSDVVIRLTGGRSWSEVTGSLADDGALASAVESGRERSRRRAERIADELDDS